MGTLCICVSRRASRGMPTPPIERPIKQWLGAERLSDRDLRVALSRGG